MSVGKKIAHRAEAVKGSAMKTVGRLTGNRRLRARGRRVKAKGNIKRRQGSRRGGGLQRGGAGRRKVRIKVHPASITICVPAKAAGGSSGA